MTDKNLKIIKDFVNSYSIETTPNVYEKYGSFSGMIEKTHNVYVTYLPGEQPKNIIDTSKKLVLEGYNVIPHLPARTIKDKQSLEKYIRGLSEESGCSKILIIGGGGNQIGTISSSIEVLESDLLSKYNFKEVGVAGHPEGSPDIKQTDLDEAILKKNEFSLKADFKIYLATQFFFEAKSLITWEKHLKMLGNKLDIHAGIPGPASLKTLLSYAKSCGIGNSIRFITKQAFNITRLASTKTPDKLIYELATYKNNNPETNLKNLHFYPFGGIKKTSDWLNSLQNSKFIYNSNHEFEL